MPIIRGSTSRGAHVRALLECLQCLINDIPDVPSERRVQLRTLTAMLIRAYPHELQVSQAELHAHFEESDEGI